LSAPGPTPLAGDAVAAPLARALADDPGWVHIFPDAERRIPRLAALFALAIRAIYLPRAASWQLGDAAAALWDPPGVHDLPVTTALRIAPRAAWLLGRRTPAALRIFRGMERRHPREPHYYLSVLGVDPAHQGKGLGHRLVAPVLERCDAERRLAWLESTNPKNHAFYHRLGFAEVDRQAFDGLTITFFARDPR
jgi:GNAT superfamily N-acetyltransferase